MRDFCLGLIVLAASAVAATPIGSVTASGSFILNGVPITGVAARTIPLVSGDEIKTETAAATVVLSDQSRVTAGANSRFKIEQASGETTVQLAKGAIRFNAAPGSRLQVVAANHVVRPEPQTEGTVTVDESNKGEAKVDQGSVEVEEKQTGKKRRLGKRGTIILVAAGAGAATGAGIALGRPSPASVESPSAPPRSGSNP